MTRAARCSVCWMLAESGADVFFFFSSRRRHTRFDCDWSSDVCSSDLILWIDALVLSDTVTITAVAPAGTVRWVRFQPSGLRFPPSAADLANGMTAGDRKSVV